MSRKSKRGEHQHSGGHERWLVSYADFITLLFAFFAVLFATSERNVEKTQEFQESIKRYLIKAGSFGESGSEIRQGEKNTEPIESPIPMHKSNRPQDAQVIDATEKQIEEALSGVDRKKYLLDVFSDDLGVRIVVRGEELFSKDGDRFLKEALPFIDRIGALISRIPQRLLIEGHLGAIPGDQNLTSYDLTSNRTLQLLKYFSKRHQIASGKMMAISYGDSKPLSTENLRLNNRIELVVLFEDSPL